MKNENKTTGCPICDKVNGSKNIKICPKCQEKLLDKYDPDVKLIKMYCNN
jgi:uncharacterized paraquat-inducible protein A